MYSAESLHVASRLFWLRQSYSERSEVLRDTEEKLRDTEGDLFDTEDEAKQIIRLMPNDEAARWRDRCNL
ncbi:uncharacterized protein N7483_012443 [Penicillium malachiteum]|uniref:uncharacterized protein n=1 Tax=Penicillium malachiteum TaxID=1324776 RepID=UPI00254802A0|nr:uncharacterized protein N7483_012443 [Penicillium malachiteum]KAJ5715262.1 hypothetical protein N7483_012443 [Penicillium malachiteum]